MASRYDKADIRPLRLQHPIGGLDRARAFQDQPPYTAPLARNVFPTDGLTGRIRPGQRSGVKRRFPQQLGSGNPVRMLASVTRVLSTGTVRWSDSLDSTFDATIWDTTVSGAAASSAYDAVNGGISIADGLRTALEIDTSKPYALEVDFTRPVTGVAPDSYNSFEINLYARYANSGPSAGDGARVKFVVYGETAGSASCLVEFYENGALLVSPGTVTFSITTAEAASGTLRLTVNEGGTAKKLVVNVAGVDRANVTLTAANSNTKQRVGFFCSRGGHTPPDVVAVATEFRVLYAPISAPQASDSTVLCASANGSLYADNPTGSVLPGNLVAVTQASPLTLASDRRLMADDLLQKLYIADNGTAVFSLGRTVAAAAITTGTDWTSLGITAANHVVVVTNPTGTVVAGVYLISSLTSTTLTTTTAIGNGTATIRVERALKIYDPSHATQQLAIWTASPASAANIAPHGCSIVVRYNNSLLLAGDAQAPHVWYMSRRDNPLDFNFGAAATDKARAVAGTSTGMSTIGQPITAIVPFFADYAVFASTSELWLMRGDPRLNGGFDRISKKVGIVDRFAHATDQNGNLYFLSRRGLCRLAYGSNTSVEPLSSRRIPKELLGIDTSLVEVSLGYEPNEDGILITLTPKDGSAASHFFYCIENPGFWEVTLPAAGQACVLHDLNSESPSLRGLMWGCRDGYVRTLDRTQYFDDIAALSMANKVIPSALQYGPFGPSGRNNSLNAMLHTIKAHLAAGSGPINWKIYAAFNGEACVRAAAAGTNPSASGTWSAAADAAATLYEEARVSGGAFIVEFSGADTGGASTWATEDLTVTLSAAGPLR